MGDELIRAAEKLNRALKPLDFPSVSHTYLPTDYAWAPHRVYLERFGNSPKRVVFLGMNPGPYGMTQTGVPFGEVSAVRDWLEIEEPVDPPADEHPKRPIMGFSCTRSEVSGRRLWGLFAAKFPNAPDFFKEHFVTNYCPLVWMKESGANITPDQLRKDELAAVEAACMEHLREVIAALKPRIVVGIGAYAEKKFIEAAQEIDQPLKIHRILHPSPASPAANKGWAELAESQLRACGVW